jgi:hypothetical protein
VGDEVVEVDGGLGAVDVCEGFGKDVGAAPGLDVERLGGG